MAQSATSLSWVLHTLADVSSSRSLPQTLRARVFLWWEGFLLWLMAVAKQRMRKIHSACHLLWHGTEAELKTGLSLSIWSIIFTRILVVENNSIVETEITQIITSLYMRFFIHEYVLPFSDKGHSFFSKHSNILFQIYRPVIPTFHCCSQLVLCNSM